jgi:hypothetical protein
VIRPTRITVKTGGTLTSSEQVVYITLQLDGIALSKMTLAKKIEFEEAMRAALAEWKFEYEQD